MRRPGFAALWLASLAAMLRDKGAALLLLGAPVLYGFFYPWFYAPQVVQRVPVALVVQDASGLSRPGLGRDRTRRWRCRRWFATGRPGCC